MHKLVAVAALLVVGAACIPLPMPMAYVVVPGVSFEVTDGSGPAAGAEVMLVRAMLPHHEPVRTQIDRVHTDAHGVVAFAEERRSEIVMPLMMHGVHQYVWSWCVSAPSAGATAGYLGVAPPPGTVIAVSLPGGSGTCGELHGDAIVAD